MTGTIARCAGNDSARCSSVDELADAIPAEMRDQFVSQIDLQLAAKMPGSNPGLQEYVKKARGLIKELFTLTDTDGSGFLDKDEIAAMLADGRVEAFKTAATGALEEIDADEVTL